MKLYSIDNAPHLTIPRNATTQHNILKRNATQHGMMYPFLNVFVQEHLQVGFSTLRELIIKRPATQCEHLQVLLELTVHEKEQVRVQAIHSVKKLHSKPELSQEIEVKVWVFIVSFSFPRTILDVFITVFL